MSGLDRVNETRELMAGLERLDEMKTPDGQIVDNAIAPKPIKAGARAIWRAFLAGSQLALRGIGKFIITVWRLATALDSALWRAFKLLLRQLWAGLGVAAGWIALAFSGLMAWLPTRTGRAYSALSGIGVIVSSLWIIDELRTAPTIDSGDAAVMRAPIDADDPILARIEGRYVHLSEIEAVAVAGGFLRDGEVLTPETAFERELVEAYVEQRLLARAALDTGLQRSPGVARRISAARDRILAATFVEDRLAENVTEDTVRALYDATADITRQGDEVRARHIVMETLAEAQAAAAQLDAGADFAELARRVSIDRATGPLGGEVGWFTRPMMEPAFSNVAFSTGPGEQSAPFQTEFGWHILEVTGRRPSRSVPFASVREDIKAYLRLETIAETVAELEEKNQVIYFRPEPQSAGAISPTGFSEPEPDIGDGDRETIFR